MPTSLSDSVTIRNWNYAIPRFIGMVAALWATGMVAWLIIGSGVGPLVIVLIDGIMLGLSVWAVCSGVSAAWAVTLSPDGVRVRRLLWCSKYKWDDIASCGEDNLSTYLWEDEIFGTYRLFTHRALVIKPHKGLRTIVVLGKSARQKLASFPIDSYLPRTIAGKW